MPLNIEVASDPELRKLDTARIRLAGRLDTDTSPEAQTAVQEVIDTGVKYLFFDMGGLEFVTSAGIRVIAAARKSLVARGGTCSLSNMQPQVDKVFQIVKALDGLQVFVRLTRT